MNVAISGAVVTGAVALPLLAYGAILILAFKRAEREVEAGGLVKATGKVVGGTVLAFGVIGLAVGAPLLGVGAYRFKLPAVKDRPGQPPPQRGHTAHGTWTTGVTLRF